MTDEPTQPAAADEQLVLATLQGEVSSFGTLVERYWNLVFALALTRINNPAEAEDVAQESFLKAYSHLRSLRRPARFVGWLSKITLQQCTNTVRAHIRRRMTFAQAAAEPADWEAIPAYSPNPGLTEAQTQFVRQTVGKLPKTLQGLVLMRFMGAFPPSRLPSSWANVRARSGSTCTGPTRCFARTLLPCLRRSNYECLSSIQRPY